jgi:hypothetical protein
VHRRFTYTCDVPQIKDGELDQEFVSADAATVLREESAEVDEKELKAHIALCATKSKSHSKR